MDVLTLNAWGVYGPPARLPILLEGIRALNPDILCLQEVPDEKLLSALDYPTFLSSKESGLAVLTRLPVINHRVFTYHTVSSLEPYRRQALLAELKLSSRSLWIATTHLAWQEGDGITRFNQTEELLHLVAPLGNSVLLSGDFNTPAESPPIQRIKEHGFSDLYAHLHPNDPGFTWDNRNPFIQTHSVKFPDRRIDYLFLKKSAFATLTPTKCRVVCQTPTAEMLYPSDHYGVLASFLQTT